MFAIPFRKSSSESFVLDFNHLRGDIVKKRGRVNWLSDHHHIFRVTGYLICPNVIIWASGWI